VRDSIAPARDPPRGLRTAALLRRYGTTSSRVVQAVSSRESSLVFHLGFLGKLVANANGILPFSSCSLIPSNEYENP
jgi:hypothetical protein